MMGAAQMPVQARGDISSMLQASQLPLPSSAVTPPRGRTEGSAPASVRTPPPPVNPGRGDLSSMMGVAQLPLPPPPTQAQIQAAQLQAAQMQAQQQLQAAQMQAVQLQAAQMQAAQDRKSVV